MIAVSVYLVTLCLSAGVVGAFAHNLLAGVGFAPTFEVGSRLLLGVAAGYVAVQLLFAALVKALKPTRSRKFLFVESASHAAAVVLIPFLMHIQVAWPDPVLLKAEPLVYLAAYLALHGALKLFSFYTALYSEPSGRLHVLAWIGAACLAGAVSWLGLQQWRSGIEKARPEATSMPSIYRIGDTYSEARPVHEGAMARYDLPFYDNRGITLRWANPPDVPVEDAVAQAHVTVVLHGKETERYRATVNLEGDGWASARVLAEDIPADATRCTVFWTQQPAPSWLRLLGFTPVVRSNRQLLLSGPLLHQRRTEQTSPNFIIIGIDGLNPCHMSAWKYERRTTPMLDRFAHNVVAFPYGYSPAPEPRAAYMSVLTGVNPLCHGHFGDRDGPMPEGCKTLSDMLRRDHYATAAFTEGEYRQDLDFGSGFENGFEWFDAGYAAEGEAAGSERTVEKALDWMENHRDVKFMVFVRISELEDMKVRARYGTRFLDKPDAPKDVNLYDTMLEYVDTAAGQVLQYIRDSELIENTCVIVFAPYAMRFGKDGKRLAFDLSEESLRVPILCHKPGVPREMRTYAVALEDVVPALTRVAGIPLDRTVDGRSFLLGPVGKDPVSMAADPFQVSVRSGNYRYIWEPGTRAFGDVPMPGGGNSRLFRVGTSTQAVSITGEQEKLADDFQRSLAEYVHSSYMWRGISAVAPKQDALSAPAKEKE
ncbi:MAG TPA: sulfatase-like hydrolase/transferase [Candidatus Hydrogenedentes bacterium]|nr:sulfatase-like hydrolase/transferase [Candidatus Hydrogenedentota bacterium]HQM48977.1 sulfatase-like hydrolase/transferase [Candidatus Hydrogenedentota bacterium]